MIKEFKTNPSNFKNYILILILFVIMAIIFFVVLNTFPGIILPAIIMITIIAFWGKDRSLITLHKDYIEAKESFATKKKLIRYKNITKLEEHRTGKVVYLHLKDGAKKEGLILTNISKPERKEFIKLITEKIEQA